MDNSSTIGVITEQGDLGLGFNPISKNEQSTIKKTEEDKTVAKDNK